MLAQALGPVAGASGIFGAPSTMLHPGEIGAPARSSWHRGAGDAATLVKLIGWRCCYW